MSKVKFYKEQKIGNGADPERPVYIITMLTTPNKEIMFSVYHNHNQLIKLKLPEWDARALRKILDEAIRAIK
ncbi:MAG: hypothetical protein GXO35_07715 [Gammaproteobacteria bacterium]|nr:hypothetical protein [Gammaproteobacteria bacterium]